MEQAYAKVALLNHIGSGNLGDDATLQVVMHNIKRRWPGAVITGFTMNPEDTRKRHGIPTYPIRTKTWSFGYAQPKAEATFKDDVKTLVGNCTALFRLLRIINALAIRAPRAFWRELCFLGTSLRIIQSFDVIVISGGGQLTEWGGPWGFPYTIFKWVLLAKFARIRCVFLNVGAGPLTRSLSKFFVTRALFAADYVSFRDEESRALAKRIGFTGLGQVFPDSAYSLEPPTPNISSSERRGRYIVGIAPMPYCDPRTDPAEKNQAVYVDLINKFATFASRLVSKSYSLVLFGSDIGVDPLAIEDLQMALGNRDNLAVLRYDSMNSIHELLSAMSAMDYVVTCRFHGVVFAHLLNKPVVAIAHHPKVTNLMKDVGLSKYCLDIRTVDANMLTETFASLVDNTDEVKSSMAATLSRYQSQLRIQFDQVFPR